MGGIGLPGKRKLQGVGNGRDHGAGDAHRLQGHEVNVVTKIGRLAGRCFNSQAGLAYAARSHQGQQPAAGLGQARANIGQFLPSPNEGGRLEGGELPPSPARGGAGGICANLSV